MESRSVGKTEPLQTQKFFVSCLYIFLFEEVTMADKTKNFELMMKDDFGSEFCRRRGRGVIPAKRKLVKTMVWKSIVTSLASFFGRGCCNQDTVDNNSNKAEAARGVVLEENPTH